jgi:hypothetical protein
VHAGSSHSSIGGIEPGAGNTIAYNGDYGLLVPDTTANSILGNSMHDNAALGIDLTGDGVTSNDPRDRDSGPNDLQNFPVVSAPVKVGGKLRVAGVLWSRPNTTYRIELFANAACDDSGHGEGETYLGSTSVTTGPFGFASFLFQLPSGVSRESFITATATDPNGSTSEFARCAGGPRHGGY